MVMANEGFETLALPKRGPGTVPCRSVVVVDDERVIADTLAAILKASGYSAAPAYGAESALALLAVAVPDLLITDVCMPGMNGVQLAIEVRQRFPRCKVLLLSGHASSTNLLSEARARGYNFELLCKPILPRDLIAHLRRFDNNPTPPTLWSEAV